MFWLFILNLLFLNYFHHHYGNCGVINWNISQPTGSENFLNDFGLEAALHNEVQNDLLKIARTPKPNYDFGFLMNEITTSSYSDNTIDTYYSTFSPIEPIVDSVVYSTPNIADTSAYNTPNIDLARLFIDGKINEFLKKNSMSEKDDLCEEDYNNEQTTTKCNQTVVDKKKKEKEKTQKLKNSYADFVGTNLFGVDNKKCFSMEEVALLVARRDFENLLPKEWPKCLPNDYMVTTLMNYFETCHQIVQRICSIQSKRLAEQVFYDTLGGYLHHYLIPVTKYSFYAGYLNLKTVNDILEMYKLCKSILNVNGNGWRAPINNLEEKFKDFKIEPLHIEEKKNVKGSSYCSQLNIDDESTDNNNNDYNDNCDDNDNNDNTDESDKNKMVVPLPKLEPEDHDGLLGNIWLPFKHKRIYDLKSDNSAFIVIKFYETVARCYQYKKIDQNDFNEKFRSWIMENIQVHLSDEQFYPGLGSILRINQNLCETTTIDDTDDDDNDNLNDKDFDYSEKRDAIQKRDKGSNQSPTIKLSIQNLDDESQLFLDNLTKSKLLNGISKNLLIDSISKSQSTPNNTVAFNIYTSNVQQMTKPLHRFNATVNLVNTVNSVDSINSVSTKPPNTLVNANIVDTQREIKTKFEEIANQSIQSTLKQTIPNTKADIETRIDYLPDDWKSPQAIALISIPILLFILICFLYCCRGQKKSQPLTTVTTSKHVTHVTPVGVPVDSGDSFHSSSSDTFLQKFPRRNKLVTKGPQAPETTSVSLASSAPPKSPAKPPAKGATPSSKGKTTVSPPAKSARGPSKTPPTKPPRAPEKSVKSPPAKKK